MRKVSAKEFFTVLWSGVCQVLGWFFGLFGYKRDGWFAKCVWGMFATSAAVITCIVASVLVYYACDDLWRSYGKRLVTCDDPECKANEYLSSVISFHNHGDGKGYVCNAKTGEKLLKNVEWIAGPLTGDSLVCFSNGVKRGYFSRMTGRVVVEPKYDHAWVFSDGLACVDDGGYIKFIDGTGKVVIDKKMPYIPNVEGYVFHGGYCVVESDEGHLRGLLDRKGNMVLPLEYSVISPTNDFKLWLLWKGDEKAVLDSNLKTIVPLMECDIYISDGLISVTKPDHTICEYDFKGNVVNDFCISQVRVMEYEKDEIVYMKNSAAEDYDREEPGTYYHPKAIARLRAYRAGDEYEGLMTADGRIVTMPLYYDIDAIGYDLYLCTTPIHNKIIVNGKGEVVK